MPRGRRSKKSVENAVAGASQEARIAKITKFAAEQSTAVKADAAEQFKAVKAVTEKAKVIKATEEKSVSSVAETVQCTR